ncbi:sulfotransferase [Xanthomonas axonopodis pv. poinsettiicola]|uniref:tetratricopeptide repeat-containing sulfotransferase family protein n=1 Tax=Xanthomonas TaxID=338 RepID=UPI001E4B2E6D|nr:sulfotransferase [Xanthomonas codiaei]MCC8537224.1 sulfotransferase [Xanthomonas codiaei]
MVPDTFATLSALAERCAATGALEEAIATYVQALALRPGDPGTLIQLSYLHSMRGRYRQARDYTLQALGSGTSLPAVLAELLPRLRTFNEGPALLACVQRLLPMSRIPIPLLLAIAAQLTYFNLPEQAITFLDEAFLADPEYPPTCLARAQVAIYLGRSQQAEDDLQRVLRRAPEIAQTYWLLAFLRKQDIQHHQIDAIRRQLQRPGRNPNERALLYYALHKSLDDLGEVMPAWDALLAGCRAKRSTLHYQSSDTEALVDALLRHQLGASTPDTKGEQPGRTPIFIVGMHRSGTTLLEQMLSGSNDVKGLGELYDFTSAMRYLTDHHCRGVIDTALVQRAAGLDMAQAGARYLDGIAWRLQEQRCFTDKLPSNFFNVGFIAQALPQARILHMVRDPMETCFSNLRELFSDANPHSYDMQELAAFQRHYARLMQHWHRALPGRILDVHYDRLVDVPEQTLRAVCNFCDIPFEPAMLDIGARVRGVVTASAVQVRANVSKPPQAKWRAYESQLLPLQRGLAS